MRLNRPDRLNAFTPAMCEQMIAAFDACDADDSVRAVVLTGNGRAFCAGADLEQGPPGSFSTKIPKPAARRLTTATGCPFGSSIPPGRSSRRSTAPLLESG